MTVSLSQTLPINVNSYNSGLELISMEKGIIGSTSNYGRCTEFRNTSPISDTLSQVYTIRTYVWPKNGPTSQGENQCPPGLTILKMSPHSNDLSWRGYCPIVFLFPILWESIDRFTPWILEAAFDVIWSRKMIDRERAPHIINLLKDTRL